MLRPLLAVSAVLLASCERDMPLTTEPPAEAVVSGSRGAQAAVAPDDAVSDGQARLMLTALPAPYDGGDVVNGRAVFARCRSCHTLAEDGARLAGPNLWNVIGERAGVRAGYSFSPALRDASFAWDAPRLDQWLENPKVLLPGNRMSFAGIADADDRRDVIAYIAVQTRTPPKV